LKVCPGSMLCYCGLAIYKYITHIFSLYFYQNIGFLIYLKQG
jgi:hypothetical protein